MTIQARKEKEVWEACEALDAQGIKLTYKAIGDQLDTMGYRRGSNSDIFRYLTTWRERNNVIAVSGASSAQSSPTHADASEALEAIAALQANVLAQMKEIQQALSEQHHQLDDLSTTVHQIEQHPTVEAPHAPLTNIDADVHLTLSESKELSVEQLVALCIGPGSRTLQDIKAWLSNVVREQEASMLKLFDHHQGQFDQYMSALEHLRQANNLLSGQIASIKSSMTVQLQDKERQMTDLKEQLMRERKRRAQDERQMQSAKHHSEKESW